jgi:RNA polymerase sigma-70 factor, ECF subfamily
LAPIANRQSEWVRQQSEKSNEGEDCVGPAFSGKIDQEVIALYECHGPSLLRYAIAITGEGDHAQDALQEAFLRYFIARNEGRHITHPRAWLFRVLRNYILDALKAPHRRSEVAIERARNSPESAANPEQQYHHGEMARELSKLLAPRELDCVRLRVEGLNYDEIAEVLNMRQGTVGATLARAHKKIRRVLGPTPASKSTTIEHARDLAREV